jgi:hypothetical protein
MCWESEIVRIGELVWIGFGEGRMFCCLLVVGIFDGKDLRYVF